VSNLSRLSISATLDVAVQITQAPIFSRPVRCVTCSASSVNTASESTITTGIPLNCAGAREETNLHTRKTVTPSFQVNPPTHSTGPGRSSTTSSTRSKWRVCSPTEPTHTDHSYLSSPRGGRESIPYDTTRALKKRGDGLEPLWNL